LLLCSWVSFGAGAAVLLSAVQSLGIPAGCAAIGLLCGGLVHAMDRHAHGCLVAGAIAANAVLVMIAAVLFILAAVV